MGRVERVYGRGQEGVVTVLRVVGEEVGYGDHVTRNAPEVSDRDGTDRGNLL